MTDKIKELEKRIIKLEAEHEYPLPIKTMEELHPDV